MRQNEFSGQAKRFMKALGVSDIVCKLQEPTCNIENKQEDVFTQSCHPHVNSSKTIMGSFANYHLIGHKTTHFIEYDNK